MFELRPLHINVAALSTDYRTIKHFIYSIEEQNKTKH